MRRTEHFKMSLPEQDDFYDVDVFNENTSQIDRLLNELRQGVLGAQPRQKELIATFLSSGTFRPADYGLQGAKVDVYMVGGGARGGTMNSQGLNGGGGGGGFCRLLRELHLTEASYYVVVGGEGGTSSMAGASAAGGSNGTSNGGRGGSGGGGTGGGIGGSEGSGGGSGGTAPGGVGGGNVEFCPRNPYDGVAYGSGGGGGWNSRVSTGMLSPIAGSGMGGGSGGVGSLGGTAPDPSRNGFLGGGGGGAGLTGIAGIAPFGGNGGRGGGGGGGGGTGGATGGSGGAGIVYIYAVPPLEGGPMQTSQGMGGAFAGNMTPAEIMACDAICKARDVTLAVLREGEVIDVAEFQDVNTAEQFLQNGVWPQADAVVVLPEGFGLRDVYDKGEWVKREAEEADIVAESVEQA